MWPLFYPAAPITHNDTGPMIKSCCFHLPKMYATQNRDWWSFPSIITHYYVSCEYVLGWQKVLHVHHGIRDFLWSFRRTLGRTGVTPFWDESCKYPSRSRTANYMCILKSVGRTGFLMPQTSFPTLRLPTPWPLMETSLHRRLSFDAQLWTL